MELSIKQWIYRNLWTRFTISI